MDGYPKIVVTPPGPRARAALREEEGLISPSFVKEYPLVVKSGRGCIVEDVDGNEYIDFNSGVAVMNVGHCHPKVVEAIKAQSEVLLHYSTDFYYEVNMELAKRLSEITPGSFQKKTFYGNSGAEAMEAAIKLAKWHTRKHRFLAFIGSFHGRSLGTLSFTASKAVQQRYFFPTMPGVTHVPYPYCYRCPFNQTYPECEYWCVDFIDEFVLQKYVPPEETAAVVFEPILGEGGYVIPPQEYFKRLKRLTDKYGLLLIDDEVQTGVGRTGRWFAIENWEVVPDIVCISKAIASGLPLGATVARAELMDWEAGSHANTFGGNPVACKVALAVIDIIKNERLLENASNQGNYIVKRLKEMQEKYSLIGDVRGKGLMVGLEIVRNRDTKEPGIKEAKEIVLRSWQRGVTALTCGVSTVRIFPPLTITRDLVDSGLEIIEGAIKEVEKETGL